MWNPGDNIFAQVGNSCYLGEVIDTDMNGDIQLAKVHFVSRKGANSPTADADFHRIFLETPGVEIMYWATDGRVPASAFTVRFAHELPCRNVNNSVIQDS